MRKTLIVGCSLIFIPVSCAPAVSTTVPIPPETPTIIPTAIVVNPPPCWGGDLIYHTQLQQMLLVNCLTDPGKEWPLTIWGWDGTK